MAKWQDPVGHPSTWQAEVEALRRRVKELEDALFKIAGKAPYADDPWDIARKALKIGQDT